MNIRDATMDAMREFERLYGCSVDEIPPQACGALRWQMHPRTSLQLALFANGCQGSVYWRSHNDGKTIWMGIRIEVFAGIAPNEIRLVLVAQKETSGATAEDGRRAVDAIPRGEIGRAGSK